MNSRRLARLMSIICDIKAHPHRTPEELCSRHKISKRQFYKDRDSLAEMGFGFHFSRQRQGFVMDKDTLFNVNGLSMADLFALVLAVRELTRLSDFGLASRALAGLKTLVDQLPEDVRPIFAEALDEVVVADGFGCRPAVLEELKKAVAEKRQVGLLIEGPGEGRHITADPKRLLLRDGALFLEAEGLKPEGAGLLALARIRKVIAMPLFPGR